MTNKAAPRFQPPVWAAHPALVQFYQSHRDRPEDLYPSEQVFLPWLARQVSTVLDVGCAAGGFRSILHAYNPGLRYSGVDLSSPLLEAARRRFPDCSFILADAAEGLPVKPHRQELVMALGWLHWEPRYPSVVREMWRLSSRYVYFDLRLSDRLPESRIGAQKIQFDDPHWDGTTTVPYVVVPWRHALEFLLTGLSPRPSRLLAFGYYGSPADTVVTDVREVCFSVFVLEKPRRDAGDSPTTVCLNLPLAMPEELLAGVQVLPPGALFEVVPREEI